MAHPSSILIFGHDSTLLNTRRWVLETAGFQVRTESAMPAALAALTAQSSVLVMLCHTLTAVERRAALATAMNLEPAIKTLSIITNGLEADKDGISGYVLDSMAGAQGLIAAARKALG